MLPQPSVMRPGELTAGWTSRRVGVVENPADGRRHAFSTLSAAESDLRRPSPSATVDRGERRSLAVFLVVLAVVLMPVEWGLFHRRLTE
jgi:hypothetical protein